MEFGKKETKPTVKYVDTELETMDLSTLNPRIENGQIMHRIADGRMIPISSMTDKHLLNTINLLIHKLEEAKKTLTGNSDAFHKLINNIEVDMDGAKHYTKSFNVVFAPYLMESVIRGWKIAPITKTLQTLFQRKKGIDDVFDIEEDSRITLDDLK